MRHYFQLIVFELPTASHPGEYFLLKGSIMTRFKYFIYRFVPLAKLRHKVKRYRLLMKHHIVLIENNKEIPLTWSNIEKIEQFALNVNGVINPTTIIKIELPQNKNCTFNWVLMEQIIRFLLGKIVREFGLLLVMIMEIIAQLVLEWDVQVLAGSV